MKDYNLSDSKILTGDLENALVISIITLITKNIYNAMEKEQTRHILIVKNDIKNFYFQEKYRRYVRGKKRL